MSEAQAPAPDLSRQVRTALAHLYDHAYLQNHALAAVVDTAGDLDQVTRAQKLRRLLLDGIEALRPSDAHEAPSDAARAHAILTYRYVDGLSMHEIAERRGLSERQAYRELEKGVEAVARILWDRVPELRACYELPTEEPADDPLAAAQAEVARLQRAARAETLDLRELIEVILRLLAPISERRGIEVIISDQEPWPRVFGDRVMLRQALLNVLSHALSTVERGDIVLRVTADPHYVWLEVAETPREEPLGGLTVAEEATTVGLTVADSLLRAQGGRLEVCRQEGGWRARLALPTTQPPTVLVIDDNRELVSLIRRYLAGHQVTIAAATDAREAIDLTQELQPRLIILDVMMPNQDGWEVLQRLQSSPASRDIPVAICSVLQEQELARAMGVSDYITKPVVQEELLKVLASWLGPLRPAT